MAFSLLNPKDPVARQRGKVLQQRFKAPPGQKPGPFSSYIGAFIEYGKIVKKAGKEPVGGFDAFLTTEIDRAINPSPSPTPTTIDTKALEKQASGRRQRRRALGRQGTILLTEQLLGAKGTLLGGSA
jgi:hypothetical protein